MKILNLYAGLGGNRQSWDGHDITAVEKDVYIATIYDELYPDDNLIVDDAHKYLLHHYTEFDFIWSSPPCQSHSQMIRSGKNREPRYPDMRLYEEIVLLTYDFEGEWVVENVMPYYTPMFNAFRKGRHLFWSSLNLGGLQVPDSPDDFINSTTVEGSEKLKEWLGIHYEGNIYYGDNHCPAQVLRNCVHPVVGEQIMNMLIKE